MNTHTEITNLIGRAALLRVLAIGLLYPNKEFKHKLLDAIAALPTETSTTHVTTLQLALLLADDEALTDEYSRLFIGGDAIMLHETSYSSTGRSTELADISGFYLAFGFDLRDDQHEIADQLGVELEFQSLLLLKLAYALELGWEDKFEITLEAAKAFLADHLGRWIGSVVARAVERQATPMYLALFEAIHDAVQRECQAFAAQPAPLMCSGPDFMQDAEFICPMEHTTETPPSANIEGA